MPLTQRSPTSRPPCPGRHYEVGARKGATRHSEPISAEVAHTGRYHGGQIPGARHAEPGEGQPGGEGPEQARGEGPRRPAGSLAVRERGPRQPAARMDIRRHRLETKPRGHASSHRTGRLEGQDPARVDRRPRPSASCRPSLIRCPRGFRRPWNCGKEVVGYPWLRTRRCGSRSSPKCRPEDQEAGVAQHRQRADHPGTREADRPRLQQEGRLHRQTHSWT